MHVDFKVRKCGNQVKRLIIIKEHMIHLRQGTTKGLTQTTDWIRTVH